LLPLEPLGLHLEFAKGEGPIIHNAISRSDDVDRLHDFDVQQELGFVLEAIRITVQQLGSTPLIGFAGAPFTVASYAIEGGHSRHFLKTKQFMYHHPFAWHSLMEKISDMTARYLQAQTAAGASVVQMFDSWVGVLGREDYREFVLPYSRKVLNSQKVPTIHFSTGTTSYLDAICEAGGDIISVDWRIDLGVARKQTGGRPIQGNLDPAQLLMPPEKLRAGVRAVLESAGKDPGFIFNLGHGVFPETPPENVELLIQEVHSWKP
jgi:uroporphyrinogen decarboxylase